MIKVMISDEVPCGGLWWLEDQQGNRWFAQVLHTPTPFRTWFAQQWQNYDPVTPLLPRTATLYDNIGPARDAMDRCHREHYKRLPSSRMRSLLVNGSSADWRRTLENHRRQLPPWLHIIIVEKSREVQA